LTDTIISREGGKDTSIIITDERNIRIVSASTKNAINRNHHSYVYLQLPLSIGYKLNVWKNNLFLITRIQLIYSLRLNHFSSDYFTPQKNVWNYGIKLNLSYSFSKHFSLLLKGQWQGGITKMYAGKDFPFYSKSIFYGVGLAQNF